MSPAATNRVEIDFPVFDPFDEAWVVDPFDTLDRLLTRYPVAFHTGINAWLVSGHDLIADVLRSPKFSTNFNDWKDAPPAKPRAEWNLYDEVMSNSLLTVPPVEHQRLRRLTAPAFSRRVVDRIEGRIRDCIRTIFDEIADPSLFNAATDIAIKAPVRSMARMLGVPPEADNVFAHHLQQLRLAWDMVRVANPMHAANRQKYTQHIDVALPGLEYLLDMIRTRRAVSDHGDDFIGTLVSTAIDGESLNDREILSLIGALIVAARTAVDVHTGALHALLTHPDQWQLLRMRPDLMESAIHEIVRWSATVKFNAIPRFPLADMEFQGQLMHKGEMVMTLLSASWQDPAKWPEPRKFDITRNYAGNIIFGAGPHLCIGLNLVKVQAKLMIEEFERRFGDTARLVGDIEYDPTHFSARRMTRLMIATGP